MTTALWVAMAVAVFVAATAIDYAHAQYIRAVGDRDRHRASRWSVIQYGAATVGFVLAVEVSLWILPFEAAGLYFGTWLAMSKQDRAP